MIYTMSDAYQALSSPVRRQILALLKDKDLSAGEISEQIDVAKSTLSGHFNVLKSADLVVTIKEGTTITFSLNTSVIEDLMNGLFNLFDKKYEKPEDKEKLENSNPELRDRIELFIENTDRMNYGVKFNSETLASDDLKNKALNIVKELKAFYG